MKILHITAHLGGGVGKVLSSLVIKSNNDKSEDNHTIACLEKPYDTQFINKVVKNGVKVIVEPSIKELETLMSEFDIIQLNFWNHPLLMKYLCNMKVPPIRLVIWYHNSGLHTPLISKELILNSHKFIFTSSCSLNNLEYSQLIPESEDIIDVVPSSGGFSDLPIIKRNVNEKISVGYLGSINFSKMHPDYVEFINKVKIPDFKVVIIGKQVFNIHTLYEQCSDLNKPNLLKFPGFVSNIKTELSKINILAYILNPYHYGSGENALLEAMYMGIVPVVLDNEAEKSIITDKENGLIIKNPEEFANIIEWLLNNPKERLRISENASMYVRNNYSSDITKSKMLKNYQDVMEINKKVISFTDIFGNTPADWFLYFQDDKSIFKDDGTIIINKNSMKNYIILEETKGSVFHFNDYFPADLRLHTWSMNLRLIQ